MASIEHDGWRLLSAEERQARNPETFEIPSRERRESLVPGDAAQLLFEIETKSSGQVIDRGVDRMWVIVKKRHADGYAAVLDSDPGRAEGFMLRPGAEVVFGPEHVIAIDRPPEAYILERFGPGFFSQ